MSAASDHRPPLGNSTAPPPLGRGAESQTMHNAHNVIPDALRDAADAGARLGALRVFTREQVVWLISRAFESGLTHGAEQSYADGWRDATDEQVERALSSLSAAYAVPPFDSAASARAAEQRERRRAADTGGSRQGDYPGGPVAVWEDPGRAAVASALAAELARIPRTLRESDYAGGPLSLDDAGWPEVTGDGATS